MCTLAESCPDPLHSLLVLNALTLVLGVVSLHPCVASCLQRVPNRVLNLLDAPDTVASAKLFTCMTYLSTITCMQNAHHDRATETESNQGGALVCPFPLQIKR